MEYRYGMIIAARKAFALYASKNGIDISEDKLTYSLVGRYEKKRDGGLLWKVHVLPHKIGFEDYGWCVLIQTDYLYNIQSIEVLSRGGYFTSAYRNED